MFACEQGVIIAGVVAVEDRSARVQSRKLAKIREAAPAPGQNAGQSGYPPPGPDIPSLLATWQLELTQEAAAEDGDERRQMIGQPVADQEVAVSAFSKQ